MTAPLFANARETLGPDSGDRVPAALEGEIRKIYARSPLYGQRFPLHSNPLQWSCYREIPALSKKEIVERGHQAFFADYTEIDRGLQMLRWSRAELLTAGCRRSATNTRALAAPRSRR